MAIYHFSSKIISRSAGRSAVAAAAYRSASCLLDERIGRSHDFTAKAGVVHSEIMLPDGASESFFYRSVLWNAVEAGEKRKDSQLSRDIEISLPVEMSKAEAIALARDFVREQFVDRGMIADLNVHWGKTARGEDQPHAHVMLTMRSVDESGFGPKVLDWNRKDLLLGWRERWAEMANERLNALGHDVRIDHRSYAAQGIELTPQNKIGPAGARRRDREEEAERAAEHEDIARRNGERIAAQPQIALDALTRQQSSFTRQDMARFVFRHTADAEQFASVMARVEISSELVRLGTDGRGQARFSTKTMLHTEHAMEAAALALNERKTHRVAIERRTDGAASGLGDEQKLALAHVTRSRDLALVVGYAGTGKSTMLGVARKAWEEEGYRVRGAALSGIAAEGLESGAGISSRTVHGLLHAWDQGRETLTAQDVLVVDEAGMIGSRQMERLLGAAQRAGAKVVLVGDPEQLQAIEAGAAFRRIAEQVGAVEITEVRRQREAWQQQATRELATGRVEAAVGRYEAAGMVMDHQTLDAAREALVAGWDASRRAEPEGSQIMLTYRRDDVRDLNERARAVRREAGELGAERVLATERGEKGFAVGDRVYFLRNDRGLGVKNGTLGTLIGIDAAGERLTVQVDGAGSSGRAVTFGLGDYRHIDHGYAATVHKSQGVTVDRAHVLASSVMDRHAAYVALTRHRDGVTLHWSADEFGSRDKLVETLGRERLKDTSLDYAPTAPAKAYAEHREFKVDGAILLAKEIAAGTARVRERFSERRENERQGKELVARWDWALGRFEAALPGMDREVIAFHDARRDLFDIGYQLEEKPGLQAFLQERGAAFGLDKRPELREAVHSRDPAQRVATMAHGMMADTRRELDRKAEIAARERALALAVAQERAKVLAAEQAKEKAREAAYHRRSPGMGMGM